MRKIGGHKVEFADRSNCRKPKSERSKVVKGRFSEVSLALTPNPYPKLQEIDLWEFDVLEIDLMAVDISQSI